MSWPLTKMVYTGAKVAWTYFQASIVMNTTRVFVRRSSFELQAADILLTTLLAQNMFPSHDTLDDLMAPTSTSSVHKRQKNADLTQARQQDGCSDGRSDGRSDREEKSDENEEVQITSACKRERESRAE